MFQLGGRVVHPLMRRYVLGGRMIKIGHTGKIVQGDNLGREVLVIDDSESTGGYIISVSESFSQKSNNCYDNWVEDYQALNGYFEESGWEVDWS